MTTDVDYIKTSIADIQSTIRALDTKIGILIVILLYPIANIGKVTFHIQQALCFKNCIPAALKWFSVSVFVVFWLLSLWMFIRAISAIDNPAKHIKNVKRKNKNTTKYNGTFYSGNLLKARSLKRNWFVEFFLDMIDVLRIPTPFTVRRTVREQLAMLPKEPEKELEEYSFEQLKLVYIRDMKMKRLKWGLRFSYLWLAGGATIYIISKWCSGFCG